MRRIIHAGISLLWLGALTTGLCLADWTLVFKGGTTAEISRYAIDGEYIYVTNRTGAVFKLKLADLDMERTHEINKDQPIRFPDTPSGVKTEPAQPSAASESKRIPEASSNRPSPAAERSTAATTTKDDAKSNDNPELRRPARISKEKPKQSKNPDPIVWGYLSRNSGCVIFREKRAVSGKWLAAGVVSTYGELHVLETQNYQLSPKKWKETQDNMDELQRRAVKDKIKFVKIRGKPTDQQLEKARQLCKEGLHN